MTTVPPRHREPLVHITRRDAMPFWRAWLIRAAAIVLALIVAGAVITLLSGLNPLDVYVEMIRGNINLDNPENTRKLWMTLQKVAILLCISLALTPAFRMRFWNCGGEGQTLAGALAAAACMIYFGNSLPPAVFFPLMLLCSLAAGALWGLLPALFKAYYGTNETLFTLMMNYVAIALVGFFEIVWESPKNSANVGVINLSTEGGWLPNLFGNKYLLSILTVALVCVLLFVYLKYSKQGYEIAVVGESRATARYVGINVRRVIVRTMLLSGALCGLAGMLLVSGADHTISTETVGGQGFTAIMVSCLAKFQPVTMVLTTFLIIFLQRGAGSIATAFNLSTNLADIITGIILFFIIGCEFFIQYQLHFRHTRKEVAA